MLSRTIFDFAVPHATVARVSALWDEPETGPTRDAVFLLAHGSGAPPASPFLEAIATGLAQRGFSVMRFAYPYMQRRLDEGRQRPPDRTAALEDAHRAALEELAARSGSRRILLAGKSLGGRMASHLAAKGEDCSGLVYLGYPLHPAKRPDKLRAEHFPSICQPSLFLQGTRDDLCDLTLLEEALRRHGGGVTLHRVEGGDHGFHVLKRSGRTDADVWLELVDAIDTWEQSTFPPLADPASG